MVSGLPTYFTDDEVGLSSRVTKSCRRFSRGKRRPLARTRDPSLGGILARRVFSVPSPDSVNDTLPVPTQPVLGSLHRRQSSGSSGEVCGGVLGKYQKTTEYPLSVVEQPSYSTREPRTPSSDPGGNNTSEQTTRLRVRSESRDSQGMGVGPYVGVRT